MTLSTALPEMTARDPLTIGVVGCGPTALYLVKALIALDRPIRVILYEAGQTLGVGTPYDARRNPDSMLANIASIELPPVTETLLAWLNRQSPARLRDWHVAPQDRHERHFFPRVVLGHYFSEQLDRLRADSGCCTIALRAATRVIDVVAGDAHVTIRAIAPGGAIAETRCDFVVLATGHQEAAPGRLPALVELAAPKREKALRLAVLGTSLSAIDVVVAEALTFGRFVEASDGLRFIACEGAPARKITMLSRRGLLPEADFYCPIPYEPLEIFTESAAAALVKGQDGDLDALFELFRAQLALSDPDYAQAIDLESATADNFAESYFADRLASDPFAWAAQNLSEVQTNQHRRFTVPWRYALLRVHEPFGAQAARFSERDLARFNAGLKRCFVDNYAAVPPLSIARLLALHRAGILDIARLGSDYTITPDGDHGEWRIAAPSLDLRCDAIRDARGQAALGQDEFPFPTLRLQIRAQSYRQGGGRRHVAIQPDFALADAPSALSRVYCLSLPFLLRTNPFVQGLTASRDLAESVARAIAARSHRPEGAADDGAAMAALIAGFDAAPLMFCLAGSETLAIDGIPAHPAWTDEDPRPRPASFPGAAPALG